MISTDTAWQRLHHPNNGSHRQQHPSTTTTTTTTTTHPTTPTIHTTTTHTTHFQLICPAPDRNNTRPTAMVRRRPEHQQNDQWQGRKAKQGWKARETGGAVMRSWRGVRSMENELVRARKIGKKPRTHHHPLLFTMSSLYPYTHLYRKTSVQHACEDAAAEQAGTPAKISK